MSSSRDLPVNTNSSNSSSGKADIVGNDESGNRAVQSPDSDTLLVGWREWVSLPQLGLPAIKAKIDTGARTSAIHAFDIQKIKKNGGQDWLTFSVQPVQRDVNIVCRCEAQLIDIRRVTDSGGHTADRYFIETELQIGSLTRTIEMTLTQRTDMLFRMLLGRTAMVPGIQVDPSLSFSMGRMSARALYADIENGVTS